jgi:protein gp37
MSLRLQAMGTRGYERGFVLTVLEERLTEPLKRRKPTTYFVNSMSDVFHERVPFEFIDRIFATIRETPHHTYQILTKRAVRMAEYFATRTPPKNAWLGVSVEDREYGLPRINHLRNTQASVRFLSVEPLLEDLGEMDLHDIHWVIVGGESGPNARPMRAAWVENIRIQCDSRGIAFFFKQWGGWGADGKKRGKKHNGRVLNGRTWDTMPAVEQPF